MPFEIQTRAADLTTKTVSFTFSDNVYQYVIGLAYVKLTFSSDGSKSHELRQMSANLSTSGATGRTIDVSVTALLDDKDNHQLDPAASAVHVTCLALVGADLNTVKLANATQIASGSSSSPVSIPTGSNTKDALLSGFSYYYGSTDHDVQGCSATAGLDSAQDGDVTITSAAELHDKSGNQAQSSIDGGLIAVQKLAGSGLQIQTKTAQVTAGSDTVFDFGKPILGAGVFLQSWTTVYADGGSHDIGYWDAGAESITVDRMTGQVTLGSLRTDIGDSSGHAQDDAKSSVKVLVVAVGNVTA